MQKHLSPNRAVVIGGSIAGLLSAKILSERFKEVIIVERDEITESHAERRGVPQSLQPHILLTHGYRLLEQFVPSLKEDLLTAGAVPIDWGRDAQFFVFGDWCAVANEPTGLNSFSCTRPLLEKVIRKHIEQIDNIQRLSPFRVEALIGSSSNVTGVRCRQLENKAREQSILADLVIDASGRSSNATKWLKAIDASVPEQETINACLGYATQRYRIPSGWSNEWKVSLIAHQAPHLNKLGYLARVENHELIATLGGYTRQYPPLKTSDFLAFAKQLPSSRFYEVVSQLSPTSKITAYRATANRLHHYEKLSGIPDGFVAIGDSVCALCPAYGQGLTTSAMSALALCDWLISNDSNFQMRKSLAFQKELFKRIQPSWTAATSNDAGFFQERAAVKKGITTDVLNRLKRRLVANIHTDSELAVAVTKVAHMVSSPVTLLHPRLLLKALM